MRKLAILLSSTILIGASSGSASAGEVLVRDQLAQAIATDMAQSDMAADLAQMAVEDDNDPLEGLNRGIFEFNRVVDGLLIKPAAQIYRGVLPQQAQDSVRSFLRNLRSPVI